MSLQKLCLAAIAASVDRHYHAFSTMDDEDMRRRFLLLQRVYSDEFLSQLVAKGLLKEEQADLVFSKYFKLIRTKWFSAFSWKTTAEIFAKIGPNLEKVVFDEYEPTGLPWKDVICHLTNVKVIIYEHSCNNGILQSIAAHCPRLEKLDVTRSRAVTDDGLKHFCRMEKATEKYPARKVPCPHLKEIILGLTSVENEGVEELLKNMPSLESIGYDQVPMALYSIHKKDIHSLDKVTKYNLIKLNLQCCTCGLYSPLYDDVLKVCVTVCPKVKFFHCPLLKSEHLELCSMLRHLEGLTLYGFGDTSVDISDFLRKKGTELISLKLVDCTVSLCALEQSCPRLKRLRMDTVRILYNESDIIPRLENLREFHVKNADLSDSANCKGIDHILKSSPALERLAWDDCGSFPPEVKTAILRCCEQSALKAVYFWDCSVETEFLKDILLTSSTLKYLSFMACNISDESVEILRKIAEMRPNRPDICDGIQTLLKNISQ